MGDKILKKVFISVGHGGTDPGCVAVDGSYEKDIALEVALYLRDDLQRHGVQVKMSREKDEQDKVADEVAECNAFKPDFGISIHCNACKEHTAKGFEVWHTINPNSKGIILAKNINTCVVNGGFYSRGLKTRKNSANKDYLAWIRQTSAPVVLCELGFIDNVLDYANFKTPVQRKNMAICLALGILTTLGIEYIWPKVQNEPKKIYTVQCGAFSVKENAEKLVQKLKDDGIDAIIVEK